MGATYNHAEILSAHGLFWDYGGVPAVSAVFWTALTIIDPAAVVLLVLRPNWGVIATTAIIIVDVIHNLWITWRYSPPLLQGLLHSPAVIEQILFMIFVILTATFALEPAGSPRLR